MTLIVALSIVPITLCAGGVVDVTMLLSTRASAQQALDAASLAAAASTSTDQTTLQSIANTAYTDNTYGRIANQSKLQSLVYDSTKQQITATAAGVYSPIFAGLLGFSQMPYKVQTKTLKQLDGTMEVALVLDNTWSMSQPLGGTTSKMATLKTAATSLVSTLMTPANLGYVKIGIVPWGDYVNVGMAYRGASWMSVPADYSTTTPQTCTTKTTTSSTTCTGGTVTTCTSSTTRDGITTTSSYSCTVGQTCTTKTTTVPPYQSCTGGSTTNYKWYGCVLNRNLTSTSIMMPGAVPYVGKMETSQNCLTAITPLSTSPTVVDAGIAALVDNVGSYYPNTYLPGGLTWGVNLLSPGPTFTDGAAYDPKNKLPRKVIVLMTDGANTDVLQSNGTVATGTGTQLNKTYSDEQAICTYAKNLKIEIYTIGVGVTDPTALSNLQSCATDSSHYFNVQSTAALTAAFTVIAGELQNVRISS